MVKHTGLIDYHSTGDKLSHHLLLWYHGKRQPFHTLQDTNPTLQLIYGSPDTEGYNTAVPRIIIIDDLMNEVVPNLFTKGSHHTNSSIIFIVQNLFSQHREMSDISLNAHYLTIMKSLEINSWSPR